MVALPQFLPQLSIHFQILSILLVLLLFCSCCSLLLQLRLLSFSMMMLTLMVDVNVVVVVVVDDDDDDAVCTDCNLTECTFMPENSVESSVLSISSSVS